MCLLAVAGAGGERPAQAATRRLTGAVRDSHGSRPARVAALVLMRSFLEMKGRVIRFESGVDSLLLKMPAVELGLAKRTGRT